MVTAYLLVNTKPGAETKVASDLVTKKEVKDMSIVYGAYDIILKIELKDMSVLQEFVLSMRKNNDIEHTSTLISTSVH